jgi:predicted ribosome quality control (RQC) complex YloA/Tae2 family protein
MHAADPAERRTTLVRALEKHRRRLARKLEGMRGDLAEAERAPHYRLWGETLLTYLRQVPVRAASVALPDPGAASHTLEIPLDPSLTAQANAARYFRRAAKGERGLGEIPPRLAAVEAELHALDRLLEHTARVEASGEADPALDRELEGAARRLPPGSRPAGLSVRATSGPGRQGAGGSAAAPAASATENLRAPSARLQPRRLRTTEGWDVLIGRNNDGNDYLTLHLARPEDYWFHVHGASGSHVVLRRGKGKNEPSKQTIEEVASWAAFYSQARTAGKVPVIVTRKKYVRKPRKAPAGTVVCEREKTLMVRPREPESTSQP